MEHGILSVFFAVSSIVIGNFMLLNLFLAILLKYIEEGEEEDNDESNNLESEEVIPGSKDNSSTPKLNKLKLSEH